MSSARVVFPTWRGPSRATAGNWASRAQTSCDFCRGINLANMEFPSRCVRIQEGSDLVYPRKFTVVCRICKDQADSTEPGPGCGTHAALRLAHPAERLAGTKRIEHRLDRTPCYEIHVMVRRARRLVLWPRPAGARNTSPISVARVSRCRSSGSHGEMGAVGVRGRVRV